jgi:NADH-quinone oxidoreductase subunit L
MAAVSVLAGLAGIGLAYALYVRKPERAGALSRRFSGLYTFLDKGWYFDALYGATFVRAAKYLGRLTREFDRRILVGGLTGGVGRSISGFGELLRRLQTGGVQNYALFILLSVLIIGVIAGAQYAFLVFAIIVLITITAFAVGARL